MLGDSEKSYAEIPENKDVMVGVPRISRLGCPEFYGLGCPEFGQIRKNSDSAAYLPRRRGVIPDLRTNSDSGAF